MRTLRDTGQDTGQDVAEIPEPVRRIILIMKGRMKRQKMQDELRLKHRELYNINGRLIYNDKIEIAGEQTDRLDMTRYANGMYILKLTIGSEAKADLIIKQ